MTLAEQALREAVRRLEELGSAEAIAQFLREQGIKGYRRAMMDCPLARYLKREADADVIVDYTKDEEAVVIRLVEYDGEDEYGEPVYQEISSFLAPAPVRDFVRRFDNGDFADLAMPWSAWPA